METFCLALRCKTVINMTVYGRRRRVIVYTDSDGMLARLVRHGRLHG